jgi:hypothetical protein
MIWLHQTGKTKHKASTAENNYQQQFSCPSCTVATSKKFSHLYFTHRGSPLAARVKLEVDINNNY